MVKGMTDNYTSPSPMIPEVIIVGIGYGGEGPEASWKWAVGRTRDLTPVQNRATEERYENAIAETGVIGVDIQTGGAPLFLDFISKELLPFIDSNYRIDTKNRILCGYSFGGLFALYTLFHNPNIFNKYLIGRPRLHFNDGITNKAIKDKVI